MAEPLGHDMLKHFGFKPGWMNINNGSFGSAPKVVLEAARKFQDEAEARPDPYLRYNCLNYLNESRRAVAGQLKVDVKDVVLVPNATTGINTVFKNFKYGPEDVLLYFSTTYGACQNILASASEVTSCKLHSIQLAFPLSDDALIGLVKEAISHTRSQGLKPRALLLDTFVSMPGVRMPFERLISLCKSEGLLSVVDGAHGYGLIDLDLRALDPDFFVSNCHKWGFVLRGCAVFYVPERNQKFIRTTFPTSHYYVPEVRGDEEAKINPLGPLQGEDTPFTKMFEFIGTIDNSPYYSIPAALKFRQEICGGETRIREYCLNLARQGSKVFAETLGTEVMDNAEGTLTKDSTMFNVRLPLTDVPDNAISGTRLVRLDSRGPARVVHWGQTRTMLHDTFIPFLWHAGSWWARISAQVYLDLEDFSKAAEIVRKVCDEIVTGKHLVD